MKKCHFHRLLGGQCQKLLSQPPNKLHFSECRSFKSIMLSACFASWRWIKPTVWMLFWTNHSLSAAAASPAKPVPSYVVFFNFIYFFTPNIIQHNGSTANLFTKYLHQTVTTSFTWLSDWMTLSLLEPHLPRWWKSPQREFSSASPQKNSINGQTAFRSNQTIFRQRSALWVGLSLKKGGYFQTD